MIRLAFAATLALCALFLSGCEGKSSNLDVKNPGGGIVYPITAEEADQVIGQAMQATFPGSPIVNVAFPKKGYMVTLKVLVDTHDIIATAMPAVGRDAQGNAVNGYAFEVSHKGTVPHAPGQASALFDAINKRAAAIRAPIPATSS